MKFIIPPGTKIRQQLKRLTEWRKPAPKAKADKSEQSEEQAHEEMQAKLVNLIAIGGSEEELINNVHGHLMIYADYYRKLGDRHGKIGARDFRILKTARTHASLITERVNSVLKGRIASLELLVDQQKVVVEGLNAREKECRDELVDLNGSRRDDYKQYNLFNAWIYFAAGILMILADVAVSVNLVAFFGVGRSGPHTPFLQKLKDPELLLFSLGIALCTVFVKIFYDEYVNSKHGHLQLYLADSKFETIDRRWLLAEVSLKFAVKCLILVALLWLLFYLAEYRTYFTLFGQLKHKLASMQQNPVTSDTASVLLKSFIGITVVVPVISGIALSVALKIFASRRAITKAEKTAAKAARRSESAQQVLNEKTYSLKKLETSLDEWKNMQEKITLQSEHFVQVYEQGFRISYRSNHGQDLYKMIEEYRNEVINQAFNQRLNSPTI